MLVKLLVIIGFGFSLPIQASQTQMIYGETGRLTQFDPYTVHEASGYRLSDLLFDSLVEIGPGYEYVSGLAKNWQINANRTKVSFVLRDDVYWHQPDSNKPAKKFTALDVVKTINILLAEGSQIINKDRFNQISYAKASDDYHVDIYLKFAMSDPLRAVMFKILPAHEFEKDILLRQDSFTRHPIGTGPYQFVKESGQGEILLVANQNYFKGKPHIEQIIMRTFTDQSVMSKSLMFSSLDLATYISPRDIGEISGDKRLGLVSYDALSYSFIGFNTSKPYLNDKRFRQALTFAINREEMLEAFFDGKGELISGPFPPSSWAYNIDIKPAPYDIERAKKLISLSGYDKQKPLIFAVPLSGDSEMIKRVVLAYQNYLAQAGVKIELQFMDWLVWKERVLKNHDYDLTIASWTFDDASNIKSLFHSSQAIEWGHNFVLFNNAMVDTLLNEAEAINDGEKRRAIYKKLHAILADESPYTYLWTLKHHAAYQKRLQRVRVEPYAFFKHVVSWHVKSEIIQ